MSSGVISRNTSVKRDDAGQYVLRYDRRLTEGFKAPWHHRYRLWSAWDRINCPILVLRGADSDLLLPRTASEMLRRNELARLEVIQNCGHAPALMDEQQIALVTEWIDAPLPEKMKVA
jgi:pimeloyl-ACP methyl ester carboxylesterase